MADYIYKTNSIEEAGLTLATADMNNQPGQTGWTNEGLLTLLLGEVLASQASRFQNQLLTEAISHYPSASADNKAAVLAKLGLSSIAGLSVEDQLPILANLGLARFNNLEQSDKVAMFTLLSL